MAKKPLYGPGSRKSTGKGRKASEARFTFSRPAEDYTPAGLQDWSLQALKKEYTRMRDAAQKRLKRLAADPIGRQSPLYEEYSQGFKKLSDLAGYRTGIEREMANMRLFLESDWSTVGGTKKTFRRMADDADIDEDEYSSEDFDWSSLDDWMQIAREDGLIKTYGSETVMQYYYVKGGVNVDAEDFRSWIENRNNYQRKEPEPGSASASYMRGNYKTRGNY